MEQDLLVGHSVTSARDLREVYRKIGAGEREHSCLLTSPKPSPSRTPGISFAPPQQTWRDELF